MALPPPSLTGGTNFCGVAGGTDNQGPVLDSDRACRFLLGDRRFTGSSCHSSSQRLFPRGGHPRSDPAGGVRLQPRRADVRSGETGNGAVLRLCLRSHSHAGHRHKRQRARLLGPGVARLRGGSGFRVGQRLRLPPLHARRGQLVERWLSRPARADGRRLRSQRTPEQISHESSDGRPDRCGTGAC